MQYLALIMQPKADPFQAKPHNIIGPQVRFARQTIEEDACLCFLFHSADPRIIEVQYGYPFRSRRQRLKQFRLSACDGFLRTRAFRMDSAYIRYNPYLWQGDITEEGNLTRHVKAHFQHSTLIA